MNATSNIAVFKAAWIEAKAREYAAKADRLAAETAILTFFPKDKLEGSVTDKDAGVSVTFKVTRKVDTAALQADWEKLNKNGQAAFKWSADVDTKTYKALQDLDPTTFSNVAAYVTTTPAKASIEIKE